MDVEGQLYPLYVVSDAFICTVFYNRTPFAIAYGGIGMYNLINLTCMFNVPAHRMRGSY